MIDKFFSVSPSRISENSDLKKSYLDDKKELLKKDSYKKDFESYLNEPRGIKKKALNEDAVIQKDKQIARQKDKKEAEKEERDLQARRKKEKDKRLHEEVALGIMASIESETKASELDDKTLSDINHENLEQIKNTKTFASLNEMKGLGLSELQADDMLASLDDEVSAMDSLMDEAQVELTNLKPSNQTTEATDLKVLSSEQLAEQIASEKLIEQLANDKVSAKDVLGDQVAESSLAEGDETQFTAKTEFEARVKSQLAQDLQEKKNQSVNEKTEESSAQLLKENLHGELGRQDMQTSHVNDKSNSDAAKGFSLNTTANSVTDASRMSSEQRAIKIESLQEVFNQSQLLASKGGGEVSLRISDKAMGDVHLKMALNEGNIQLEILTQSKEAKKMIEENLSELKSSLALQQMNVEHVRINSVSEANTENRSQFDSESFFQQNEHTHKSHQESAQDGSSRSSQAFSNGDFLGEQPVVSLEGIKKAAAKRVYENHKAQALNAVA